MAITAIVSLALTDVHSYFSPIQDPIKSQTDFCFKALIFIYSMFSCLLSKCRTYKHEVLRHQLHFLLENY